ncbi:MAG TPA: protein kinase [Bryobacteraceae bacterium]|nr:protein kinase [Bryobacteraceae bacterium]
MVGGRLLHYDVLEPLGSGGMGVVYKARDTRLNRLVAIKVLPADKIGGAVSATRFIQEARTASALNHPNIVQIYDVNEANGVPLIVMEFVAGRTLDRLIREGGLRLPDLLGYAVQIADALQYAHSANIVHRDLKPANVMVAEDDRVKLLDFGLAKLMRTPAAAENLTTRTFNPPTEQGFIAGTPAYMSPEQAEGKEIDARSDIFSFGSLLYEMATGRRAFQGTNYLSTISAVLNREPEPVRGVPVELEKLIAHCLRKNRERRIQHMDDVRVALEDLREQYDSGSPVRSRSALRRRPVLIGLSSSALLVAVIIGWFVRSSDNPDQGASAPAPLTSYAGNEVQPSFSPDGNQVAFVWDGEHQDNADIYVKLIGSEKPLRLTTDPDADISPAWSPDGRFIAFVRHHGVGTPKSRIMLIPAIGGSEKLITELSSPLPTTSSGLDYMVLAPFPLLAWAQDGKALIFPDHLSAEEPLGLFVLSLETRERFRLTTAPPGSRGDAAPALSPDGRSLIFSRATGYSVSDLYRLPLTSGLRPAGEPVRLTSSKEWNSTPVWTPDGREIIFSAGSWYLGPFNLWRTPAWNSGAPRRLSFGEGGGSPALSPQRGRLVFSRAAANNNIWRVQLRGKFPPARPVRFISSTRSEAAPQYSPDGARIVFTSNRSGEHEVWTCDSEGSNPVQLTFLHAAMTGSPHWSPDGKQIVFDSNADGRFEIYVINAGGGAPRRLTADAADNALASFSQDGRYIYFSSNRTGNWQVWKMPAGGGAPIQVTRGGGRAPVESRDGKFLYYEHVPTRSLWRLAMAGGEETKVLDSVAFLNFAVSERGIYFFPRSQTVPITLQFFSFARHAAQPIVTLNSRIATGLTVAPDAKSLLYTQVDQIGSDLMIVENFR